MRASKRTAVVLLLGAALAVAPSALSASAWSSKGQSRPTLGALDQAWQLVGRFAGWLGGFRIDSSDGGPRPDPTGKANPGVQHRGRPSDVTPDNGPGPDPNGGAAPHHG